MFKHAIITRFNVKMFNREWNEERAKYRLALFESITCQSLLHQTNKNFHWLVLCDTNPSFLIETKMLALSKEYNFEIILAPSIRHALASVMSRIETICQGTPYLITSRIDADDAVSFDYVEQVQNRFCGQELTFINFECGLKKAWGSKESGKTYLKYNPFQSLIEKPMGTIRTIHCIEHPLSHQVGEVLNISESRPFWLQVIHADNVSNGFEGKNPIVVIDNPELHQFFKIEDTNLLGKYGIENPLHPID